MKNTTKRSAIALGLMAISNLTSAHSMMPAEIKEYVSKPVNKFSITIRNAYKKNVCYSFTQGGRPAMMSDVCLDAGESRKLDFYISSEPDKQTNTPICSSPRFDGNVKVSLCTIVKTYYPQSRL